MPAVTAPGSPQAETADSPGMLNGSVTPERIAGAMIRSMLGSSLAFAAARLPNASALSANLPANPDASIRAGIPAIASASQPVPAVPASLPDASAPVAQVPLPRKSARNTNGDASAAAAAFCVAVPASPPPANPVADSSPDESILPPAEMAAAPGPAAPQSANPPVALPRAEVAFTAVLTPMKEIPAVPQGPSAPPTAPGNQTEAAASSPSIAASPPPAPTPAAAPSSTSTPRIQAAEAQNPAGPPQAASDGSSRQQPGQQEQSAPETTPQGSTRPESTTADPKSKALAAKAGDAAAQPAAPSLPDHGTMFPPPALVAAADSPRATSPASTPRPEEPPPEGLRSAEASVPAAQPERTGAAQEISIRIASPGAAPVDLRVSERSGQVSVDVRTNDAAVQTSLRQDLGALTHSLERAGYHAEIITPASPAGRAASASPAGSQDRHQDSSRNGGGSPDFTGGRRQQQKRTGNWLEQQEDQP